MLGSRDRAASKNPIKSGFLFCLTYSFEESKIKEEGEIKRKFSRGITFLYCFSIFLKASNLELGMVYIKSAF